MKNKALLALTSGMLLTLGWPTYGFAGFLFFGIVPLLFIEEQIRLSNQKKRAGGLIFFFSFFAFAIWNISTTWWIWNASAIGSISATFVNSSLMSFIIWLYHHIRKRTKAFTSYIFVICAWITMEKFHMTWDLSWPWLTLGNGFASFYKWIQWYEFTGVFGGTIWIWVINISVFEIVSKYKHSKSWKNYVKVILGIVIPILISYYLFKKSTLIGKEVEVVILQPNVDPYTEKFSESNNLSSSRLIALSEKYITKSTEFIIAPETTLPDKINLNIFKQTSEWGYFNSFLKKYPKTGFLLGATTFERFEDVSNDLKNKSKKTSSLLYNIYNSALLLQYNKPIEKYHKSKLVVGVELMPFMNVLKPLLGDITIDLGGTVNSLGSQPNREVFENNISKVRVAPIICYESVYGEFVTSYLNYKPDFLAIITNDGWWGNTQGHKQHLTLAQLRAIETRKFIARSANTGISAIINTKGEVVRKLDYGISGAIVGSVQLNQKITFYSRYGDYISRISNLLTLLIGLSALARKKLTF